MKPSRREFEREIEEWKRALPRPKGQRAAATGELRDHVRAFVFGFRDWLEESMRPEGMTMPQLRMLFAVRYGQDSSSAKIARLCQVTPQTLQAMLERAEREGWLQRRAAAHNQRILVPTLTPRGEALLQQAMDATAKFEQEVWRDVTLADLQQMNAAFAGALRRMEEAGTAPPRTPPATDRSGKSRVV